MTKRITERELILPALYVLERAPGQHITTSELIIALRLLLQPQGEDLEILAGRKDDKFSQKVRNLKSHGTLLDLGYASWVADGEFQGYRLLCKGKSYLDAKRDFVEYVLEGGFSYEDVSEAMTKATKIRRKLVKLDENVVISEGKAKTVQSKVYERSAKLRKLAIEKFTVNGTLACAVCGFDFYAVYGAHGEGYIQIHHERPIFQFAGDEVTQVAAQALKDLKPLCANCHCMVHRKKSKPLTVDYLRAVVELHRG